MFTTSVPAQPTGSALRNALVLGAVTFGALLAAGNVYLLIKAGKLEADIRGLRTAMKTEMASLASEAASRHLQNEQALGALRRQTEEAGARSAQAVSQASTAAKRYSEQLTKKIEQQQQAQMQQQLDQHRQLTAQLGEIRHSASETTEQVTGIAGDVRSVKSDVAQTRTDLEKTVGELRSVRGDLGVQSGLIATNARELAALKALGERTYIEFQLPRTKAPQRIGEVAVQLKRSDPRRNRFTIELIADDKRVEKKDRTINEPVQFYVAKARVPYEIVVNQVQNDKIVGYLAAPKVKDIR
ncbi:MAG: hypothetical protein HY235_19520 [Acidobacteria bacterium]|nr:hypothetical protein [Acidobacteriota bacterium]